jgi:hypothetical protein
MECLVCLQKIECGEKIFLGSQGVCRGETDWEYGCSNGAGELVGVIHLSCLESPAQPAKTPNTVVPERVEEESEMVSVVERSDALSLFDL